MAHQPNIYIEQDAKDCRVLVIQDITLYDSDVAITNPVLKVSIPGDSCEYFPPFAIKTTNYYTTNSFGITQASCGQGLQSLPDGIYKITYSVCPNDELFTTQYFLRDCQTRCVILSQISNLIRSCNSNSISDGYGNDITNKRIQELKDFLTLLDAAEVDAKNAKFAQSEQILSYINKKLNSFFNNTI